ncbi:hypothetical protein [Nannocystis punicea]|uniref:Uncharacterized protein n=1 Tax=Nannocystis punicea TaxID=2995304 RepID=A0ABY7GXP0_9BACT|nr:hypothetical protein [Nannocystis poenicansa]WAS91682.1 hypothetical protein O0S08_36335 [Nannocystis poenicansa]
MSLPRLMYRLCQAEWEDVDPTLQGLADWTHDVFAQWWKRDAKGQELLRRAVHGVARKQLGARQRDVAVDLCRRGLLVETIDGYALNGAAWKDYVSTRP